MKRTKRIALLLLATVCLMVFAAGCSCEAQDETGAVTTASVYINMYTNMDQAAAQEALSQYSGLCNVATVSADGTPNLAIFVPGVVDEDHIMFGWADNATKANVLRDKQAVITYDVANPSAETKEERHQGAILKVELEEDQEVLDAIYAANENISDVYTILKIVEVLPIG